MKQITRIFLCLLCACLLFLTACNKQKKQEQTPVGTCANHEVLYEELRYITMTNKALMEHTYGSDIWSEPAKAAQYRTELEATVWDTLRNNYAVLAAVAAYLPELTLEDKEIRAAVDEAMTAAEMQYGGKEAFEEALSAMYMTEHLMRFTLGVAEMEERLLSHLTEIGEIEGNEAAFSEWLKNGNCVYIQHIFLRNDPEDDPNDNLARCMEAREAMLNGTDIGYFIARKAYNEDANNTAPYFLVKGIIDDPKLETAALALVNEGDISMPIESGGGYYVLRRMENPDAAMQAQLPELLSSYQWSHLEDLIATYRSPVQPNEYGKSIDLVAMQ